MIAHELESGSKGREANRLSINDNAHFAVAAVLGYDVAAGQKVHDGVGAIQKGDGWG